MKKEEQNILTLHLSKRWYDMIASGEKTEEYREVTYYWTSRFLADDAINRADVLLEVAKSKKRAYLMLGYLCGGFNNDTSEAKAHRKEVLKPFTHVRFICGYPKDGEPYIEREIDDITVDKPKKGMCPDEWVEKFVYVIRFNNE